MSLSPVQRPPVAPPAAAAPGSPAAASASASAPREAVMQRGALVVPNATRGQTLQAQKRLDRVVETPVVGTFVGSFVSAKRALFDSKGEAPGEHMGVSGKLLRGAAFPFVALGYWVAGTIGRLTEHT